jgi:hypothetical protein
MRRLHVTAAVALLTGIVSLGAQGRGAPEWTTSGFNAQRTAWVRSDARLTKEAVQKGEFQFLWKMKFDNTNRQLNSLTTPVLLDLLIGYRGFKSLAFFGGASDRVISVDTDLARPYWTATLTYTAATGGQPPSSWPCRVGALPLRRRHSPVAVEAEVSACATAAQWESRERAPRYSANECNGLPLRHRAVHRAAQATAGSLVAASAASNRSSSWAAMGTFMPCT